jgi:N-acetylneuraminate synthase
MSSIIVTAEIGINHNGEISIAKELIKVAKLAGCDYVKFQKRDPDLCVPEHQKKALRETPWGTMTYLDYRKRIEFHRTEYESIDKYCKQVGIPWFASIWDKGAVEFFRNSTFDLPFVKVPSCCNNDGNLVRAIESLGIPVILSTGMTDMNGFTNTTKTNVEYILACTSTYPTPAEEVNLEFIKTLKKEYEEYKIGFSNHSPGLTAMLGAVVMGAEMIEMHITLDRSMWGTDQAASIEPTGVAKIVHHAKQLEKMIGTGRWTVFPGEQEALKRLRK